MNSSGSRSRRFVSIQERLVAQRLMLARNGSLVVRELAVLERVPQAQVHRGPALHSSVRAGVNT